MLLADPGGFEFFQAVRTLERLARQNAHRDPSLSAKPVGEDHLSDQEAVNFRSQPSLCFPPSPIVQVHALARADRLQEKRTPFVEMVVSFFGLTGPTGVLPDHYTALILRRMRYKDYSLRDFLDLFNHRAISLFYRAWCKYRLPFAYERTKSRDRSDLGPDASEDPVTQALYCLVGLGTRGLRGRLELDDEAILYYAGHFAHFPRSASGVESILGDYFAPLAIRINQLQGQWLHLEPDEQSKLPSGALPRGLNNELGASVVAGARVWDVRSKFRVVMGPMSYRQFEQFLPDRKGLRTLCQLVRIYVGPEFDFDVQLVLLAEEVPVTRVGHDGSQLGWNSWIRTRPFAQPARDAVFSLDQT
jgi:type VI secretion system protein ImpH